MNKNLQKNTVRKSIVRNVEVPVKNSKNLVVKHNVGFSSARIENDDDGLKLGKFNGTGKGSDTTKYVKPELNSCLTLAKKMDEIRQMKPKHFQNVNELTPRSKQIVSTEVTKKLNFPTEKTVFKGLIPLNVNDSILMESSQRKPIWKKKKSRKSTSSAHHDLEPELCDFRQPIKPLNLKLPLFVDETVRMPRLQPDRFQMILELYEKYGSSS